MATGATEHYPHPITAYDTDHRSSPEHDFRAGVVRPASGHGTFGPGFAAKPEQVTCWTPQAHPAPSEPVRPRALIQRPVAGEVGISGDIDMLAERSVMGSADSFWPVISAQGNTHSRQSSPEVIGDHVSRERPLAGRPGMAVSQSSSRIGILRNRRVRPNPLLTAHQDRLRAQRLEQHHQKPATRNRSLVCARPNVPGTRRPRPSTPAR